MLNVAHIVSNGIALACAATLAATPAQADETRHCNIEVMLRPQNASQTWRTFEFQVFKTVGSRLQVNQARRAARGEAIRCVNEHWAEGLTGTLPARCADHASVAFRGYPFTNIVFQANQALCEANPDVTGNLYYTVELNISGDDGCYFGGSHDPVVIASNQRAICLHADAHETEDEATAPEEEDEADMPPIGDGGDWECVGDDCVPSDAPATEPEPEEEALPATARYQLLPLIRLPGNDLYMLGAADGLTGWMDCRQACTDDARCGAWTWRAPTNRCLIKSRPGIPIPDGCCRSGIKQ